MVAPLPLEVAMALRSRPLLLPLLLILSTLAQAEMGYRRVLPDGSVEFSDQPSEGAAVIPLTGVQTYSPPPLPQRSPVRDASPVTQGPAVTYTRLEIVSPKEAETLRINDLNLALQVAVEPALVEGDMLIVELDGKEAMRGRATQFVLSNVPRGSHTLRVRLIGHDGKEQLATPARVVYTKQFSQLH